MGWVVDWVVGLGARWARWLKGGWVGGEVVGLVVEWVIGLGAMWLKGGLVGGVVVG